MFESSAKFITLVAGFATQMILARMLGPEQLGVYFLFFSIIGVFVIIVKAGMDIAVLKLVAEAKARGDWDSVKGFIVSGILFVSLFGLIMIVLLWFFSDQIGESWFNSSLLGGAIRVGCVIVLLMALQFLISESYRGLRAIGYASYFQGPVSSLIIVLVLTGLWLSDIRIDLNMVLVLITGSLFVSVWIAIASLLRMLSNYSAKISRDSIKKQFSIATPMLFSNGTSFILAQADIFIIGLFLGESAVGYYGATIKLVGIIPLILMVIRRNLAPIVVDLYYKKNIAKLEYVMRYASTVGFILCLPVALILIIWSSEILGLIYGAQFTEGSTVLALLAFGKVFHAATGPSSLVMIMTGHHKAKMYISTFVAIFGVAGFLIAVKSHGKEGVAMVAVLISVVQNSIPLFYTKIKSGVWTHPSLKLLINRIRT